MRDLEYVTAMHDGLISHANALALASATARRLPNTRQVLDSLTELRHWLRAVEGHSDDRSQPSDASTVALNGSYSTHINAASGGVVGGVGGGSMSGVDGVGGLLLDRTRSFRQCLVAESRLIETAVSMLSYPFVPPHYGTKCANPECPR